VGAVLLWLAAGVGGHVAQRGALGAGSPAEELAVRRRVLTLFAVHHLAALVAFASGFGLMRLRGWGFGYPRWLAVKIGLTLFLLVPLVGMHAWVCRFWIAPGLAEAEASGLSKRLARGLSVEEMLRALAVPLLGVAVPLLLWLSLARPF
jgi:hypothetical protein